MGRRRSFRHINYRYHAECNRPLCRKCGYLLSAVWYCNPRVDLNLHRLNASQMSGRANLDMCLYDGGVKARSLQMKIEGSNKSGTGFQVIKSDSADTIDYAVSMNYGDEVFLSPVAWSSVWITWIKQQRVRCYFPGNGRRYVVCQCPYPDNTTL